MRAKFGKSETTAWLTAPENVDLFEAGFDRENVAAEFQVTAKLAPVDIMPYGFRDQRAGVFVKRFGKISDALKHACIIVKNASSLD